MPAKTEPGFSVLSVVSIAFGVIAESALVHRGLTYTRHAMTTATVGKITALITTALLATQCFVIDFAEANEKPDVHVSNTKSVSLKKTLALSVRLLFRKRSVERILFRRLGKKRCAHPSPSEHQPRLRDDSRSIPFAVTSRHIDDCTVTFSIETACHLSKARRRRYLKAKTREWLLNSTVLDEIENDLQLVVNCSRPGDVLLLDTSKTIRPPSRTVISWPLTISGYVWGGKQDDVEISASEKRTVITCPQMNEGLFSLR